MRITGNGKLDPDFSNMKKHTLVLGSVPAEKMVVGDSKEWLLPRINPVCENCGNNQVYHVVLAYFQFIPLIKTSKTHHIICSSCGESIELDPQEYSKLKPFL